ncbi:MAG: glycosyltransferase family 4 protein [Novosphingobium sp.]|uniref:glycosyltransferase family 4 protein n=1 Tax=Novosphingobium sp. TaxID=1874826 RepID=UPI0032BBC08E
MKPLRVLHLHSSFSPGGKELRAAKLMNAFGPGIDHVLISGVQGQLGAAAAINSQVSVQYPCDFPALSGRPTPWRLFHLAKAMRGFDLVLTYNWGAMDAVAAHRFYRAGLGLAPLVHHEDGFNQDEIGRLNPRRNLFRRIALGGASALVVPSRRLEGIAGDAWRVPARRLVRIANGIDLAAYGTVAAPDAVPGLIKKPGDLWLGTLAGLRAIKNLPRLVRAFAAMPAAWQLVIVGEGPERGAILAEAQRLGVAERVHLPGFASDPARVLGLFDLFALSSDSEQFPISVVEAMAGGLAVVSPAVGDVAGMVASENADWIVPTSDDAALGRALADAAADPTQRAAIGAANRDRARRDYDEASMIAAYRAVYGAAMGKANFP